MKQIKVVLSIFILGVMLIGSFAIIAFVEYRKEAQRELQIIEYTEVLEQLRSTIQGLKEDISQYKIKIDELSYERDEIKKELRDLIKQNEETDVILDNNTTDENIDFLSKYLSSKDTDKQ